MSWKLNDEEKDKICELYSSGFSCRKIANKFDVYYNTIRGLLKRRGIVLRPYSISNRIYKINHDIFQKIDTPEKAYLLGLIWSDGCIFNKKILKINLHKKDIDILYKIKRIFGTNVPIRYIKSKNQVCLTLCSQKIFNNLYNLGCRERKSYDLRPPPLKETLKIHFIRGFFDGDGGLSVFPPTINFIGTLDMMEFIGEELFKKINIKYKIIIADKKCCDPRIKRINVGGRIQVIKSLLYLYKQSTIHLDRKFNITLKIINQSKYKLQNGRYSNKNKKLELKNILKDAKLLI